MARLAVATTALCAHALAPTPLRTRRATVKMTATVAPPSLEVGAQNLDWPNIGFEYRPTRSFVHYRYRNGEWDGGALEPAGLDATVPVSIGATALHYGQSLFEGLKAFACKDGSVRLFRPTANATTTKSDTSVRRTQITTTQTQVTENIILILYRLFILKTHVLL